MFAVVEFEVFVLMSMTLRLRLLQKSGLLQSRLAAHGLSLDDGHRISKIVAEALGDDASFFDNLKGKLSIAGRDPASLEFESVLWPGFVFRADLTGEARYHYVGQPIPTTSLRDLKVWSVDVDEFDRRYGPLALGRKWPIFDEHLSANVECEFEYDERTYGAGFSWGLFLFAAQNWE